MKRTFLALSLILSILPLSGCKEEEAPQAKIEPPSVGIMTIEAKDAPYISRFHAQTAGSKEVEVRAQVSGILVSRHYEEGEYVKEGQLLFTIEPDKYKANLKQAQGAMQQIQARHTQTRRDWERISSLYAKNAVSQRDRDSALAAFESAKADLLTSAAAVEEAEISLKFAYVKSPVNGYASKEAHSIGNLINPSSPEDGKLTVIKKVDPIYVNFSIPSPDYMRMRTLHKQGRLAYDNPRAVIELADGSEYDMEGKLSFLDNAVNPATSVVSARAVFPNPDLFVLPGQFVRLTSRGILLKDAILIPQQAVMQTKQGPIVTVVDGEGKAQTKPVKSSISLGEWFLVDSGLAPGDRLVVDGLNRAIPGLPVRIDEAMTKHVAERFPLPSPEGAPKAKAE